MVDEDDLCRRFGGDAEAVNQLLGFGQLMEGRFRHDQENLILLCEQFFQVRVLDGQVVVTRTIQVQNKNNETASQFTGGFNNTGGSVRSNAVTLETHTHTGVVSGKSDTGNPSTGT